MTELIYPDWPAPARVRAVSTTRRGGVSTARWASFNLGDHVGDDSGDVVRNRELLREAANLPASPQWLEQVHGCQVLSEDAAACRADARFTSRRNQVCAVLTADCLPLLLCDHQGSAVAAVHAGWRGLAAGVIENTLDCFATPRSDIMAWLGPAIGPAAFEVGEEVKQAFVSCQAEAEQAFLAAGGGKWLADIYLLARLRLNAAGVTSIHGGGFCTWSEPERFFSYRRDGQTGRMASLIWLEENNR